MHNIIHTRAADTINVGLAPINNLASFLLLCIYCCKLFEQTCCHVYGKFSRRFGYWITGNPVASSATIGRRVTRVGCAQIENRHEKHGSIDGDVSSSNTNFVCVSSSDRFSCEVPSVGGGPDNGWYW